MDEDLEEATKRANFNSCDNPNECALDPNSRTRAFASKVLCNRIGLLVLVTGYSLLGAVLFKTLEGDRNAAAFNRGGPVAPYIQKSRDDCLRELWLITERLNVLYERNWTKLVTEQLKHFEYAVIESGRTGSSNTIAAQWTFSGALIYSLTLLTTIGYGRLSPRTALGKIAAIVYALIGVPLMLVLLSALGSLLAGGCRRIYSKLCRKHKVPKSSHSVVGFHKPSTGTMSSHNHTFRRPQDDCAAIQITTGENNCRNNKHIVDCQDHMEMQKKTILATVRMPHARGGCRKQQVRQMLAEAQYCAAHYPPTPNAIGFLTDAADIEEDEEENEQERSSCIHDTPSRVPLICRLDDAAEHLASPISISLSSSITRRAPSVPASVVVFIFAGYVCLGAFAFARTSGWSFLDAVYFCFIALSTIGLGDRLPHSPGTSEQIQLFACCAFIFLGLVLLAMCFSLIHDELAAKCRHVATKVGLK